MAVLKCKMCGGELTIREGVSIVKCDYCGNTNTLPKENSANNHDLFARANELRVRCEFDLAERAYEKIIEVAPQEAEAYWGLVLCKYGIEYVEDPKAKKRIPTCHRTSFEAITADYNYQKAIEYADVVSRPVYEEEARVIDAIQKEILALSYKEEKYDVFICYKETDDSGKRTEDSAIANDIYYQLTQEGYKVFYAAITLEDKLGQDYEPIIFAALNSAKVMLVVGTKTEYFNAVWVKNEWSRYLKIMKQDRTKLMFPCYKGISAYELPDELSHMQAQDMGKIGFINDLIRGIKKVIVKEKPKKEASSEVATTKITPSKMNPTLRRAFIFIEDGNWEEANEYLEKVLDDEPENAFAYLGKLLIDLKVKKQEKLADLAQTFDNNPNYKKAYKFADKELKEKLAGYNEAISKRNDEKSKDEQYSAALTFVSKAKTEEEYKQAGKKFAALSGWKDSSRRAKDCFDKAEAIRKDAIYTKALALAQSKDPNEIKKAAPLFESIPDWKDSTEILVKIPDLCETARKNAIYEDALQKFNGTNIEKVKEAQKQFLIISEWKDAKQKAELCVKRVQELEEKEKQDKLAREKAERERQIAQAKKKKLIKKVSIISTSAVVAIATVIILLFTLILPTINFNKATDLLNAGKYDEAMAIYKDLDGFGNSTNKINVIEAMNKVEDGDYENGIEELLENGAIVTISYDTAGGELNTINTMSARSASATKGVSLMSAITAYADDANTETSFTYNNLSEFEGLKPSTRNGYTFKKWTLVTCSPEITKDTNKVSLTFIAEWTAKSYTVTYNLDGGSVNGENVIGYNPDDESFTLINPTRTGYTFMGWTGTDLTDKTMEVTVPSGSYGNREYTANWQANTYTVTYDANGGTASKTEDTAIYDKEFNLATVERKGYTFLGWFVGQTKYEDFDNWELDNGLDLVAEWEINTYTITYTLNGGSATNTETYTVEDTVVINAPEKTGYTFDGWTGTGLSEKTKSITLAKGTIGNKEYIANWTAKTYKVTFNANGGTASKTEDTAIYDSNFTLATAERKGYEFVGWKADGKTYTTGDWKTDKNVELVAEWKVIDYTLSYSLAGGSVTGNVATYTVNDTVTLKNPTKIGYTFSGWTGTDLTDKTTTVTIAKGSIGNRSYTANWTAKTYTVTYDGNEGTPSKPSDIVTYDSNFTPATAERYGYEFVCWKYNGEEFTSGKWNLTIDITLVAEWKIPDYDIIYNLDGGTVEDNPTTYTVEDAITLKNPTKTGYTFAGWTGTDLSGKTMTVTIVKGTIGNRSYTANWTANTYTLTYNVNGGNALADNTQSVTYDANYSVITPTRTGYSFVKWATSTGTVYSGGTWKTANDVTVIAEWSANTYTVNYNGNGGTPTKTSDTATYDKTFTLTTASRTGYEFVGWKYNGEEFTSGKWNLTKDITLVAEWEIINYAISYNLDGGSASGNPATYTVENTVTLNNPTRTGYTFVGWSGSDITGLSMNVTISKGTIEPKAYTANWEIIEYTIGYDLDGGTVDSNPLIYTVEDTITLNNPTKTGYTFTGWTGTDLSDKTMTVTIAKGTINPRQYVANWEANSYTLTFEANGGTVTPTSTTVIFDSTYDIPTPFKTGHDFNGWYFGDKLYDGSAWKDINNIIVTAKWTPHIYTVTLGLNGGNCETEELKIAFNSDYSIPNPKYFGYDWLGWYKDDVLFEQTSGVWTFTEDINLVAQWQKQDKIKISTTDDLNMIAYDMTAHYILVNNIDLQSIEWSMIGDASNPFKGIFDGQGFTISNLKVSKTADNVGLFGVNEGTIKNLTVENANITSGTISAGVLVGQNSGIIENCSTSGSIINNISGAYVGGFVGFVNGNSNISNCSTNVNILCDQATQKTYTLYAGGFVGKVLGTTTTQVNFVKCSSTAPININISYADKFSTSGSFSINHKLYTGGFAGNSSYSNYEQCFSNTTIECTIGNGRDKNSYNDSRLANDQKHYAYLYCGGFSGAIDSDSLNNCYSSTQIKSESKIHSPYRSYYSSGAYASTEYSSDIYAYSYIGGLVGYSVCVNVQNSYSVYDINAYTCASTKYANTYGENTTYAYSYIGGMIGYFNSGNIANSFSSSNGLNIVCESITIDNYWTAAYLTNVSSAIIGYVKAEGTATNNYYVSEQEENDTHGTRTTLINLQSASFVQNTLGWDTTIWELKNGSFPTLK